MTSPGTPAISVIIPTYNRADMLGDAIRGFLQQQGAPEFEVIVVDNNSKDGTRAVVAQFEGTDNPQVRYVFEGTQGVSHARNTGIRESRGPILAFLDDDVRPSRTWLAELQKAFGAFPDAAFVGGSVLPLWPRPAPQWLTPQRWGPLALQDYGAVAFEVNPSSPVCLVSANLAIARKYLGMVGGFDPAHQHAKGDIAASEDQEIEYRIMNAGGQGVYWPQAVINAAVQPDRLEKAYYRKWHLHHGRAVIRILKKGESFNSNMVATTNPGRTRSLFGVPFWTYRQLVTCTVKSLMAAARGNGTAAFGYECDALEAWGTAQGFIRLNR